MIKVRLPDSKIIEAYEYHPYNVPPYPEYYDGWYFFRTVTTEDRFLVLLRGRTNEGIWYCRVNSEDSGHGLEDDEFYLGYLEFADKSSPIPSVNVFERVKIKKKGA